MPIDSVSGIDAVNSVGAASSAPRPLPTKELSPDDFIKLFLAQMRNQNPMNPTDASAIVQQMAQIGSIKSSKSLEVTLTNLSKSVDATLGKTQVLQATQLIGKKVEIPSKFSALSANGLSGSALLPGAATAVNVTIKDETGKVVKTINNGSSASGGLVDFTWDGIGDDGKTYAPGAYQIYANAVVDGKAIDVPTAGSFSVNSVALNQKNGGVILNVEQVGGISLDDIVKIL